MPRRRKTVALTVLLLALVIGGGLFALGRFGLPEFALDPQPADDVQQATSTAAPERKAPEEKSKAGDIEDVAKALSKPKVPDDADEPSFDIAKISPDGTSVFAGRAKPNAIVSLTENGKPIATAKADENGEWTMTTEHRFTSADPNLGLDSREPSERAPDQDKVAAATPALPRTPQYAPEKEREKSAEVTRSPNAIAEGMIKNLEGLVADARKASEPPKENRPVTEPDTEVKAHEEPARSGTAASSEPSSTPPQSRAEADEPAASDQAANTSEPAKANEPAKAEDAAETGNQVASRSNEQPAAEADSSKPAETNRMAAVNPAPKADKTSVPIPVPIMFVYREATFTEQGERAAKLLLEYLKLKNFDKVSLSGHADERGSEELNYDLSEDRLIAVEKFLRDGGFTGELQLVPKGKTEPYTGVDRSKYDQEELYQLDRRVELHVKQ